MGGKSCRFLSAFVGKYTVLELFELMSYLYSCVYTNSVSHVLTSNAFVCTNTEAIVREVPETL